MSLLTSSHQNHSATAVTTVHAVAAQSASVATLSVTDVAVANTLTQSVTSNFPFSPAYTRFPKPGMPRCFGAVLGPNGKVYPIPCQAKQYIVVDPDTLEYTAYTFDTVNQAFAGGVLAKNNKIYCVPHNLSGGSYYVLVIDTADNSFSKIYLPELPLGVLNNNVIGPTNQGLWCGAVLAANGQVVCMPYFAMCCLIINPDTDTLEPYSTIQGLRVATYAFEGMHAYHGGAVSTNGLIVAAPYRADNTLVLNLDSPVTNVPAGAALVPANCSYNDSTRVFTCTGASFIGNVAVGDNMLLTLTTGEKLTGYVDVGGVAATTLTLKYALGQNLALGSIVSVQQTRKADVTSLPFVGDWKFSGAVLAPNGKVYIFPQDATQVLIVDVTVSPPTQTNLVTTLPGGFGKFRTAVCALDGKIYGIPCNYNVILVVDPANNSLSYIPFPAAINQYASGVLLPDGRIMCLPFGYGTTTDITLLNGGVPNYAPAGWMLKPYFNKM